MQHRFTALSILILCTACHNIPLWKYDIFERPEGNGVYPEMYLTGWKDGCESGANASSNRLYRMRYKFKQDWELMSEGEYVKGWEDSYNFCRKYILQYNTRSSL